MLVNLSNSRCQREFPILWRNRSVDSGPLLACWRMGLVPLDVPLKTTKYLVEALSVVALSGVKLQACRCNAADQADDLGARYLTTTAESVVVRSIANAGVKAEEAVARLTTISA